jgi:adenylyltransferase/sulfurtransferase
MEILRGYDVVVDGTDNFQTRYLTNDACVLLGIPNVYGSVLRFEGQASVFATPDGPCYRCLFREPPPPGAVPTCEEGGVLGVLPGLVGTIQATEAIKLVLGAGETLAGRLLLVDALRMSFRTIALRRDPACPACGTREIRELVDYDAFCGVAPAAARAEGGDAGPLGPHAPVTPRVLAARLAAGEELQFIDVREPYEHRIARVEGARLVPLRTLPESLGALDAGRETVVLCHHGVRSASAAELLRRRGFRSVRNVEGGIEAWSLDVDAGVPRY